MHRVNYSTIATQAETTEAALLFTFKQILSTVDQALRREAQIKLNMKVGFLKFRNGAVSFENFATVHEIDQLSAASTFSATKIPRIRKFHTPALSPRCDEDDEDRSSYAIESLKDTISRITQ